MFHSLLKKLKAKQSHCINFSLYSTEFKQIVKIQTKFPARITVKSIGNPICSNTLPHINVNIYQ